MPELTSETKSNSQSLGIPLAATEKNKLLGLALLAKSFSFQDGVYGVGLILLFIGLIQAYSLASALIVLGAILSGVSIATSFFVTWLSTKVDQK